MLIMLLIIIHATESYSLRMLLKNKYNKHSNLSGW